ncbi:C40 family peptidase [Flavihumibacter petaseus]|nr:C40 family peptidase [Flavihumibacter petaseus]
MNTENLLIPTVAVCAVRTEADHRSEMSSQLLLGEQVFLLDELPGWLKVRSVHDGYEGWCQAIQLAALTGDTPAIAGYYSGHTGFANVNGQPMQVFMGTPVYEGPVKAGVYDIRFTGLGFGYGNTPSLPVLVEAIAFRYLNTSYCWGGRTPAGIDCSGFAQMVYRQLGVHLLRDAWMQAGQGEEIGFLPEARCGDLAFFDEPDGRITHVGILLNDHEIIHASGKVRVDDIDHQGIISRDQGRRTHRLRLLRRITAD